MHSVFRTVLAAALISVVLTGCEGGSEALAPEAAGTLIGSDISKLYNENDNTGKLTFEEALARGLRYNLDTRVAAYETLAAADDVTIAQLEALPNITAKWDYIGRSNAGAGSSLSVLTHTQSLQPSISTDQRRTTAALETNWNLLDAALSVARAKSSSDQELITEERRRKVFENVVQDVYSAYWRCAAAQEIRPMVADLLGKTDDQISKIKQGIDKGLVVISDARKLKADLMGRKQQLLELQNQLSTQDLSLKALIGLPPHAHLELDPGDVKWLTAERLPKISDDTERLETLAIMNRPEVREEILNKDVALRDIRLSIFETFPGADIILGLNHDQNHFLVDNNWLSITGEISQSITKILTLPARLSKAKTAAHLADARRQALLAAVITEVHVARVRYDYFKSDYDTVADIEDDKHQELVRAQSLRNAGITGDTEVVSAALDEGIARVNQNLAFAQAQESYGQFLNSLGIDIWAGDTKGMTVPQLASELKRHLADLEQGIVEKSESRKGKPSKS